MKSTAADGSLTHFAIPLRGDSRQYDALLNRVGEARFVLLGEASHGTREFYHARAEITQRLIREKGFTAVAVEADWPDAYRINRYVRGASDDTTATEALGDFELFPAWMWRNTEVREFVEWLRQHNENLPQGTTQTGFYGLDLYSLNASIQAVLGYLEETDPEAARRARERYGCFEDFGANSQAYGYATATGMMEPCEDEVVEQLIELQQKVAVQADSDHGIAEDRRFYAEQNARLVKNAEEYYRSMFRGRASSWNLRDSHMVETLEELIAHLNRDTLSTRTVVWAHNSHLGDARATEMGERGEHNVGQLIRQKYGNDAVLVGFSTNDGTVTAASEWDQPAERKRVRPALAGSYEALFHTAVQDTDVSPNFMLDFRDEPVAQLLQKTRLERAIGVIYRPETERWSHYFHAVLPEQFDAVVHFDKTEAVEPLERTSRWERGEVPETFPTGI
ncbi:MAG: hypothetical protein OHK0029_36590 [Armatimonadaceae bacterium]